MQFVGDLKEILSHSLLLGILRENKFKDSTTKNKNIVNSSFTGPNCSPNHWIVCSHLHWEGKQPQHL
jgi:hypothetical protein